MEKRALSIAAAMAVLLLFASGCGIIGGAFEEPVPGEENGNPPNGAETATQQVGKSTLIVGTPVLSYQLPSGCMEASAITLRNVGQVLCAWGKVYAAWQEGGNFIVDFSKERGRFYMSGIDWATYEAKDKFPVHPNDCVYAEGKIVNSNSAPIMAITPRTLKICPAGKKTPSPS